jgi:hypothetical protein
MSKQNSIFFNGSPTNFSERIDTNSRIATVDNNDKMYIEDEQNNSSNSNNCLLRNSDLLKDSNQKSSFASGYGSTHVIPEASEMTAKMVESDIDVNEHNESSYTEQMAKKSTVSNPLQKFLDNRLITN